MVAKFKFRSNLLMIKVVEVDVGMLLSDFYLNSSSSLTAAALGSPCTSTRGWRSMVSTWIGHGSKQILEMEWDPKFYSSEGRGLASIDD